MCTGMDRYGGGAGGGGAGSGGGERRRTVDSLKSQKYCLDLVV